MKSIIKKILYSDRLTVDQIFRQQGRIHTFLNPCSYLVARRNKKVYLNYDRVYADGMILAHFVNILFSKKIQRRSMDMTSLADPLFKFCDANNKTIYFLGSKDIEIKKFVSLVKIKYNLKVVGYRDGYIKSINERDEVIQNIIHLNPDFLLVGMGSPIQEKFLNDLKNRGWEGIGFTCGGFFHQSIKKSSYYPHWIDKTNTRFLYRIYKEKHTRSRYLEAFIKFPYCIMTDVIIHK